MKLDRAGEPDEPMTNYIKHIQIYKEVNPIVLDTDLLNYLSKVIGRVAIHDLPIESLELRTYLVPTELLRIHEMVIDRHVKEVMELIMSFNGFKYPIIVDARTFTVLDGHHRLKAALKLGLKYVPVFFVDYAKDYIHVTTWRKEFIITKKIVVTAALRKLLLPPKTSRHILVGVTNYATFISLECLRTLKRINLPLITPDICLN